MPSAAVGVIGASSVLGGLLASNAQKSAASEASSAQTRAAALGVEEQSREFDEVRRVLAPYVQRGTSAISLMGALAGLPPEAQTAASAQQAAQTEPAATSGLNQQQYQRSIDSIVNEIMSGVPLDWGHLDARAKQEARIRGSLESLIPGPQEPQYAPAAAQPAAPAAQPGYAPTEQQAIADIIAGPEYGAYLQEGENAILQNASATGGLRGGNVQASLAKFRPTLLADLINQRFARLGQIAGLGQASAAGQAAAGLQTGTNIANLYGQQGAAQAGQALAAGQANANLFGGIADTASTLGLLKLLKVF